MPPLEGRADRGRADRLHHPLAHRVSVVIAVLIPLLFMGGVIGRLFSEFAVTPRDHDRAVPAVVSLTLVPMLCARMLRRQSERHPSRFERISEGLFNRTLAAYEHGLRWVLRHQGLTLLVAALTLGP